MDRFDLLVHDGGTATLIEFKYYLLRRTHQLDGTPGARKGGPGTKNETEFFMYLDKLRDTPVAGIHDGRLVLVYERDSARPGARSLHRSYGTLTASAKIADVTALTVGSLEARILRPSPPRETGQSV